MRQLVRDISTHRSSCPPVSRPEDVARRAACGKVLQMHAQTCSPIHGRILIGGDRLGVPRK